MLLESHRSFRRAELITMKETAYMSIQTGLFYCVQIHVSSGKNVFSILMKCVTSA